MEHGACNVIYIDRRANEEHVRRESLSSSLAARTSTGSVAAGYFGFSKAPPAEVHTNVESILSTFNEGNVRPIPLTMPPSTDCDSTHLHFRSLLPYQNHPATRIQERQHAHNCTHRHTVR
jgi:hypothetical protein